MISDWRFAGLNKTTASFADARAETAGALGIEVALAGSGYAHPCHRADAPTRTPVPSTVDGVVDGLVEGLTNVVGFTVLPVSDTHIGDRAAKTVALERNSAVSRKARVAPWAGR